MLPVVVFIPHSKDFKIDDMLSKVENRTNKDEATDVR